MNRRDVIKNSLMALAVSFLPKVLQPSVPEVAPAQHEPSLFILKGRYGNVYMVHKDFAERWEREIQPFLFGKPSIQ